MNRNDRTWECWIWSVALFLFLLLPPLAAADTKTWQSQADWQGGSLQNIDAGKTPGNIQIFYDPAQQQYLQTPFIYVPNSGKNTLVKIDTKTGEIIWTYDLSSLGTGGVWPSRTTVDTRGNVWLGLRDGTSHVVAISGDGKHLATHRIGQLTRAVTIDKNGDIWVGSYQDNVMVKISGTTFQEIKRVSKAGLCPYGATTDSYGNIWVSSRCGSMVLHRIDAGTEQITLAPTPAYGTYGIAADRNGDVWAASYENQVVYRVNGATGQIKATVGIGGSGRGVAVDSDGNAWIACSNTPRVVKVSGLNNVATAYTAVGGHSIGIAVDSTGVVWVNSYNDGRAYKLRASDGAGLGSHPVCDVTNTKACLCNGPTCNRANCTCTSTSQSSPYTYSDMTGFQLQVIVSPSSGTWSSIYDGRCDAQFTSIAWTGSTPGGTQIRARARTAATQAGLAAAAWGNYVGSGQPLGVATNRFIEVQFFLETQDSRVTPIVSNATLTYNYTPEICDGKDNDCNGQIDEFWPNLGQNCTSGVGTCQRPGTFICHPNAQNVVCSATPGQPQPEVCDGQDNDCNGQIDETFGNLNQACNVGVGDCQRSGNFVCRPDGTGTQCSATPGSPQPEVCDGKDNDCNGQIDETWPNKGQACTSGVGVCESSGTWVCRPDGAGVQCSAPPLAPTPEVCDNKDNDCNGSIDDGVIRACSTACGSGIETCTAGQWDKCSAQQPTAEVCDGKDNDCDGQVDNGLTRACSTACGQGTETCVNGQWAFCDAQKPTAEVCDGKDNDCNGQIDENIPPKNCQGDCGSGTATCQNGTLSGCSGPKPEPETCDGKDNDCNGKIDDNIKRTCSTACGEGSETCENGKWVRCNAPLPGTEICDGKDNNCDGKIDEGSDLCPAGMVCSGGQCRSNCRNGECPKGQVCDKDICIGTTDPCQTVKCSAGEACVGGRCVDACFAVSCPQGQICEKGQCIEDNCYRKGCPTGQRCVNGVCEANPCQGITCPQGQFCRDGQCISSCASVKCSSNQVCIDGRCEDDPTKTGLCQGVTCASGQRCVNGTCQADPCGTITCPKGRICIDGSCDPHDPCVNVECPQGQRCVVVEAQAQCVGDKPSEPTTEAKTENAGEGKQEEKLADGTGEKIRIADGGTTNDKDQGETAHNDKNSGGPNTQPDQGPPGQAPGSCGCTSVHPSAHLPFFAFLAFFLFGRFRRRP